jgi:FixJ family two-component response regulator
MLFIRSLNGSPDRAIQAGAKDFVVKPFQPSRVLEAVQRVLG